MDCTTASVRKRSKLASSGQPAQPERTACDAMDLERPCDNVASTADPSAPSRMQAQTVAGDNGRKKKKKRRHHSKSQSAHDSSNTLAAAEPAAAPHMRVPTAMNTGGLQDRLHQSQKQKKAKLAHHAVGAVRTALGAQSLFLTASDFPLELLAIIFDMVADDVDSTVVDMTPAARRRRRAQPFHIAAVCQRWRDVAFKTPALWRNVELLSQPTQDIQSAEIERERLYFNHVRHRGGRSKGAKFRVRLVGPLMCVTRIRFERIANRVESLHLHASGCGDDLKLFSQPMASLEALHVHADSPPPWNRTVHLASMPLLRTITSSGLVLVPGFDLPNLRALQLHGKRALTSLASLLPYAPVIDRVELFLDKPGHRPLAPCTFVRCDTLKTLIVHCDRRQNCGRSLRFLRRFFRFRALERLEVRWTGEPARRTGKEDKDVYALPALAMLIQRATNLWVLVLDGINTAHFKGSNTTNALRTFLEKLYDDAMELRQLVLVDIHLRTWAVTALCKFLTTRDSLGWMWCHRLQELVIERPMFAGTVEKRRRALMRLWEAVQDRATMRRSQDEAELREVRYVKEDGEAVNVLEMMKRLS